ncbi:putative membrane protein YdjX (TVP38/TMEM64 family) [Geomicrobium halophilum]|uniref:TVP38/TMEM64 family membrane protein n=1 Tax=Geomicrobium halophilum TaxID=549000 RepID=A0A841PQU5_9BACL|nr:VTT domain-containing protein [Geomicrobium halophilum]MBB6451257.1 putative membrane protein YdjX (TVP38/TMEM64 family) [Geomicrobium halophilum]
MDRGKIKGIVVIASVILMVIFAYQAGDGWNAADIQDYIDNFGFFAPFLFLLLSSLRPVILVPASVLGFAGGLLFGLWGGVVLTMIGSLLAATLGYFMAEFVGAKWIEKKTQGVRLQSLKNQLLRYGFYYVLFLRLTPIISFDLISILSGITRVPFSKYIAATALGILPGAFFFTFMGASVAAGDMALLLTILGIVLLVFIGGMIFYVVKGVVQKDREK